MKSSAGVTGGCRRVLLAQGVLGLAAAPGPPAEAPQAGHGALSAYRAQGVRCPSGLCREPSKQCSRASKSGPEHSCNAEHLNWDSIMIWRMQNHDCIPRIADCAQIVSSALLIDAVAYSQRISLIALETHVYLSDDSPCAFQLNSRMNELMRATWHGGLQFLT